MIDSFDGISIEQIDKSHDVYLVRIHDDGGAYGSPYHTVCVIEHDRAERIAVIKALAGERGQAGNAEVRKIIEWIWESLPVDIVKWYRLTHNEHTVTLKRKGNK